MPTDLTALELLVLQPTPFCNISCGYCYLPDRDLARRMTPATMRHIFQRLLGRVPLADELSIVWHAGEPMVLPPAYYRQMLELIDGIRPARLKLIHSMQTNGTLIDDEWCRFIAGHDIRIGLSIDGPRDLHDRYRKTRNGCGTHAQALRGLRLLQQHGIDFHVITVLTRESLQQPEQLFRFYLDHGITRVGFNIEEIEGSNKRSSLDFAQADSAFRSFLTTFIGLMRQQPGKLSVREFDELTRAIVAPAGTGVHNPQVLPGAMISVDWQGQVSTFSPELLGMTHPRYHKFVFAQLNEHAAQAVLQGEADTGPLPAMFSGPAFERTLQDIQTGVDRCRLSCPYFALCGGGAPANKLFENGSFASTETLYCRLGKKAVIDTVLGSIEYELREQAQAARNSDKSESCQPVAQCG